MASSSYSSSSSQNWSYDVFPSFSGEDVRKTFLSYFLKELDRKLIIAFKDNEIQRSRSLDPELKHAIKNSRIAVVVFSKNYASSSWCLNELLEIVKCKKEFGQMVIPVFYGLDPSHVRKQTGDFGKIFGKTCQNKTEDEKIRWKGALTDVANILGYHSVTWANEASMVEEIANDVLGKLNLSSSDDFKDFVGIEDHISRMSPLLHLESEEVRMVGIWGPSGIGKTTIARALFSRLSRQFQSSVFTDKVFISKSTEVYSRANLVDYNVKLHLQKTFLAEVLGKKDMKIDDLGAIEKMLKHRKALIFIDDLDDQDVLDALAGQTQWFGNGSRIIVVTKDRHFLRAHGIDHIYEVCLPSEELALQMFCRSAFRKNYPPDGFKELSSEVALRAGNLPLGLNVLGSYLRGRDKEYWMDMLPRLRNGLDRKIEKTLRVSYEGLENEKDEAIFRHIACVFNGEKVVDIKLLLADSNLDVNIGLKHLIDKSLIHERWNTVEMHSLLQEMGKDIVRTQSNKPGEREFLLDSKDICDVLEHNSGTEKVLGIALNNEEIDELHIHESSFKGMSNLLFLKIYNKNQKKDIRWHLPERFDYWPTKLRFLRLDGYPKRCMPSNFRPENLVKLHMRGSNLEKLWDGVQSLTGLKNMDLSGSLNLKEIPDLSMAINLEILCLFCCSSLVELPYSVQYLNKLEKLEMEFCENLEILPTGINLQSLYRLDLRGCSRLRSFPDISTNISELWLDYTGIEEIPPFIRYLNKLEKLKMEFCKNLEILPTGINLQSLDQLNLRGCSRLRNFPDISTNIRVLNLAETGIEEIPPSIRYLDKLEELEMHYCENLEILPTGINLQSLYRLDLKGCSRLRRFPDISTNISGIYLDKTGIEEVPWWIENFSMLEDLSMGECDNLRRVSLNIFKLHLDSAVFSDCFKFDPKALIQQQHGLFKILILSGEEVPSCFTHRTTGTSLTNIPLPHTSPSQPFLSFRCCVAVHGAITDAYCRIQVCLRFVDRLGNHFDFEEMTTFLVSTMLGGNLCIINYCVPLNEDITPLPDQLNYDHVNIQFRLFNKVHNELKIKGCGIRIFEDGPSLGNRPCDPNILQHVCGGNTSNNANLGGHETEDSECGDSSVERKSSCTRIRMMKMGRLLKKLLCCYSSQILDSRTET